MSRYLITLTPLEPFLFGGNSTFGALNDKENGTYLVKSRRFPQQSAILGMLKKEIMTQAGVLTRKVRGEWVDAKDKCKAEELTGNHKFDITQRQRQDFGVIQNLGAVFLMQGDVKYIKKAAIDNCSYKDGLLKNYDPKQDIYDNFVSADKEDRKRYGDIFKEVEQTGNKKGGEDNSLFKKTSYLLKDNFKFAFYLDVDFALQDGIVTLGADRSKFKLEAQEDSGSLEYEDKNGYLTLLSDAYITVPIRDNCEFAITSEISFQTLAGKKHATKHNTFTKSEKVYLYEK